MIVQIPSKREEADQSVVQNPHDSAILKLEVVQSLRVWTGFGHGVRYRGVWRGPGAMRHVLHMARLP